MLNAIQVFPGSDSVQAAYPVGFVGQAAAIVEELQALHCEGGYDWKDFAVLYRTNAQSSNIEDMLVGAKIPYSIHGGKPFFMRTEIYHMIWFLRSAFMNDIRGLRGDKPRRMSGIGNISSKDHVTPNRFLGEVFWNNLDSQLARASEPNLIEALRQQGAALYTKQRAGVEDLIMVLERVRDAKKPSEALQTAYDLVYGPYIDREYAEEDPDNNKHDNISALIAQAESYETVDTFLRHVDDMIQISEGASDDNRNSNRNVVRLMTNHRSKGLEFPVVFMIGVLDGLLPHFRGDEAEERRLFYVGVTRAKDKLFICSPQGCTTRGGKDLYTSRFIYEAGIPVPDGLKAPESVADREASTV